MASSYIDKSKQKELLEIFFKHGGLVTPDGYRVPPHEGLGLKSCVAFRELQETQEGQRLLKETLLQVKRGEIGQNGCHLKKRQSKKKKISNKAKKKKP